MMQEQAEQTPFQEFIRVVVRKKPQLSAQQKYPDDYVVINQRENFISLNYEADQQKQSKKFYFDTIFDEKSTQKQIFNNSISPLVNSLFQGVNANIWAFGQTGSGKTYTLIGKQEEKEEEQGMVYRIINQIFNRIRNESNSDEEQKGNHDEQYKVFLSLYTLYNEQIQDLLGDNQQMRIKENPQTRQIYIENLNKIQIIDEQDFDKVLKSGIRKNLIKITHTSIQQSRQFFFVEIQIQKISKTLGKEQTTYLKIVEFSGLQRYSDRSLSRSLLHEKREAVFKTMQSFFHVTIALTDKISHIPYRDSKLTRILQNGLGGDQRALMIFNLDPQQDHFDLIYQLRVAERIENIRNKIYSVNYNDIL